MMLIPRRTLLIVSLLALCSSSDSTNWNGDDVRSLPLEHVYCDPMTKEEAAAERVPPSMVAKAKCKGASCPVFHGKEVMIQGCRWDSVNGRTVFVEETSGWYFFYVDAARSIPLRPSEEELTTKHSGETGYLRSRCGVLRYHPG